MMTIYGLAVACAAPGATNFAETLRIRDIAIATCANAQPAGHCRARTSSPRQTNVDERAACNFPFLANRHARLLSDLWKPAIFTI